MTNAWDNCKKNTKGVRVPGEPIKDAGIFNNDVVLVGRAMYVSCERVFHPSLNGRPVVLSYDNGYTTDWNGLALVRA